MQVQAEAGGAEEEGKRDFSRLCAEHGAPRGARSRDSAIRTLAKTKRWELTQLCCSGAPGAWIESHGSLTLESPLLTATLYCSVCSLLYLNILQAIKKMFA